MPRTGADIVVELHGLLEQAQEKGPFVSGRPLARRPVQPAVRAHLPRPGPRAGHGGRHATGPGLAPAPGRHRGDLARPAPPTPDAAIPGYAPEAYDLDVLLAQIDAAPAPMSPSTPTVLLTADKGQQVSDPAGAAMVAASEKVLPEARARFQAAIPGSRIQPVPGHHPLHPDRTPRRRHPGGPLRRHLVAGAVGGRNGYGRPPTPAEGPSHGSHPGDGLRPRPGEGRRR